MAVLTSITAPYTYAILVWSLLLQALVWHDLPSPRTLGGATLIVGGALFVFFREQKRKRKKVLADQLAAAAGEN